jgi:hypothetical protein
MSNGHTHAIARAAAAYVAARDAFDAAARRHTASGAEWRAMIAAETQLIAATRRALAAQARAGLDTFPHTARAAAQIAA